MLSKSRSFLLAAAVFCASLFLFSASLNAAETGAGNLRLRFVMDDSPPFTFSYMGLPTGLGTDVLRLIWKDLGEQEHPIITMPWTRAIKSAEVMPDICLFVAEWTPERAKRFKFAKPVYVSTVSVVVDTMQAGSVGCIEALRTLHVALPRMENVENELTSRGTPIEHLDRVATTETAVRLMVRHRAQAVAGEESALRQQLSHYTQDSDRFERVCVFNRREMGFLFSKDIPDEVVQRYQNALDRIRNSPAYDHLLEQYMF